MWKCGWHPGRGCVHEEASCLCSTRGDLVVACLSVRTWRVGSARGDLVVAWCPREGASLWRVCVSHEGASCWQVASLWRVWVSTRGVLVMAGVHARGPRCGVLGCPREGASLWRAWVSTRGGASCLCPRERVCVSTRGSLVRAGCETHWLRSGVHKLGSGTCSHVASLPCSGTIGPCTQCGHVQGSCASVGPLINGQVFRLTQGGRWCVGGSPVVWQQKWPLFVGGLGDRCGVAVGSTAARGEGASLPVGVVAGTSRSREGREVGEMVEGSSTLPPR